MQVAIVKSDISLQSTHDSKEVHRRPRKTLTDSNFKVDQTHKTS